MSQNPKTWKLVTDDDGTLKHMARTGLIVKGPKLVFSIRNWRWMYSMTINHLIRN